MSRSSSGERRFSAAPRHLPLACRWSPLAARPSLHSLLAFASWLVFAFAALTFWPAPLHSISARDQPARPALDHPDRACRRCHQAIYDSYQRTPMARASGDAAQQLDLTEGEQQGFTHAPSNITYRILLRQGRALLTYDRPPTAKSAALHGERLLEYFIGSGNRGRTFLYQQDNLWFETPINWYARKRIWDMAPAYTLSRSMPAPLPVDANCLHCHAGEVQASTGGARNRFPAAPFRAGGIGCAACHGDPTEHLAHPDRKIAGAILNPAGLDPVRRDSVCLQCHLEGDEAIYLPGKSLATFLPGQDLWQTTLYFVDRNRAQQGQRATSQYEALLRSACKRAAGDKLTCTTCHDPHSSPAPAQRVAYFRARCLACHTSPALASGHHPEQQDCAACHMPTRKTLDIAHEQATDHDIEARPPAPAPLQSRLQTPDLVPVGSAPAGPRELGLAYAQLVVSGNRGMAPRARTLLEQAQRSGSDDADLHTQLGYLLQISGQDAAAAQQYQAALRKRPQDATAAANLAILDANQRKGADALRLLELAVHDDPSQTATDLDLAFFDCRIGHKAEARTMIDQALFFNPDSTAARQFLQSGIYAGQTCKL